MNAITSNSHRDSKLSNRSWARDNESWDEDRYPREGVLNGGFSKYLEPFFIYKKWILGWILTSALLGWIALLVWPRSYESACKLQFNIGRESVGLDPSTTTTQTLMLQKTQEEDINSALELLGSREMLEMVVDEIGVENILSGYLPSGSQEKKSSFLESISKMGSNLVYSVIDRSGVRDPITDRERAIIRLGDRIEISAPKKSSTMIVRATAKHRTWRKRL